MKIIGITGGFKTGKSTVLGIFKNLGAETFDADELANKYLRKQEVISSIKEHFKDCEDIIENGSLNRKKLGDIVFSQKEELKWLNALIHPLVKDDIEGIIKNAGNSRNAELLIFEIPLLYEADMASLFDNVIVVICKYETEIARAKEEGYSETDTKKRIAAQLDVLKKQDLADFTIDNNGNIEETKKQVLEVYKKIKE